jgi:hypothetical protein
VRGCYRRSCHRHSRYIAPAPHSWGFALSQIAACGGPVLVATSDDDLVCAPQIARWVAQEIGPAARLYESHQCWNHDFMICELDKVSASQD